MTRTIWTYFCGASLLSFGCSSSKSSGDADIDSEAASATATTNTTSSTGTAAASDASSGMNAESTSTTTGGSSTTANSNSAQTATATSTNTSTSAVTSSGAGGSTTTSAASTTGEAGSGAASTGAGGATSTTSGGSTLTFFVTSQTSTTADIGGLSGADATCAALAEAVGAGDHTWRAYLSAENDGSPIHAKDRIGSGPWVNANGITVAENIDELHARTGDVDVFVDENGMRINGQWEGSPTPNQHDILTGSTPAGELMEGMTCEDWTSSSSDIQAQIGHSDGLGPGGSSAGNYSSWNSSHANQSCADTAPLGGAGRFYCFAAD